MTSTSPFAHQLLLHQPFRSVPTTVPGPARHQLAQGPGRGVDAAHGQGGLLWGAGPGGFSVKTVEKWWRNRAKMREKCGFYRDFLEKNLLNWGFNQATCD